MNVLKPFLALCFGASLAMMSGCVFDADDDEDDADTCITSCEDAHEECIVDCDDDACTAVCDTDQDECETECG
jgi:hypothetical protein